MANAKKLSVPELKSAIATYVAANKIAQSFSATYNLVGLLDKIGKIYTVDQMFIDKLQKFDGEFLSYGKTVEEWAIDLILPTPEGSVNEADALTSAYPTYRPTKYSYDLGDQVFKNTYKYNDLNKGVHNEGELSELIYAISRSLANSVMSYRYAAKRQLIGRFADAVSAAQSGTTATDRTNAGAIVAGTAYRKGTSAYGIAVKSAASNETFDAAVAAGDVIKYTMLETIAAPVDTSTGEAFIKQVKKDVEIASDISEGNSLSGNTLGATQGLTLIIKQGMIPSLDVDTLAGAFNGEKLAIPAEIITVPDFGTMTNSNVYAVLVDNRAVRLFPTFDFSAQQENGAKAFMNYFRHFDATAAYSMNAFVKVYQSA